MKKSMLILSLLMLVATPLFADNDRKIRELQREKEDLQASYQHKVQEMKDISIRMHEIDTEIAELAKDARNKKSY